MRLAGPFLVALTAVTLAVAASGCGDSKSYSGTKPSTWAATTCGALTTWRDSLLSGNRSLSADLLKLRDLKAVKARLLIFLRKAERSTKTMISEAKSAGAPAVEDGAAIQRDLERGLIRARSTFRRALASAEALPADNSRAFARATNALGLKIRAELSATGAYFTGLDDKYDSEDLRKAVSEEPACRAFTATA
jgi:hypothetical protein